MMNSGPDQEDLLLEIQKLRQDYNLLKENFDIAADEYKNKEESFRRRNDILLKLTDFSSELAFLPYTEIYPFIVARIKELFGVKGAWVTSYDEECSELVVEFSSLSLEENSRFLKVIGRNILKFRTPVNQEHYSKIMTEGFGIVYSVHDLTFGAIPDAVGKVIESMFNLGWFVGIGLKHKNKLVGTLIVLGEKNTPIPEKDEFAAFTGIASNALGRKKAEESLRKSEERFRSLVTNSNDIIQVIDAEGYTEFISDQITKVLGYEASEFKNISSFFGIHPDDLPNLMKVFNEGLHEPGTSRSVEYRFRHKNGSWVELETVGCNMLHDPEINGIVLNVRDISERRRAEEKLVASEEKFRKAFQTSPDAYTIRRLSDGIYISVNKGFEKITGYTDNEVIGKSSDEFDSWVDKEELAAFIRTLKEKGIVENLETKIRIKDGTILTGLMSAAIIKFEGTEHILAVTKDITRQKNIEREIILAKEKAEQSDRLKTVFLQNLSHEIRTPMNAICGFAELLRNNSLPEEDRERYTSIIQNSGKQLLSIVTDILTVASIETKQIKLKISKVNINQILTDLSGIFKEQAAKKSLELNLVIPLSNNESIAYTDETKITQIITNLLTNAIKFTNQGYLEFGYSLIDSVNDNDLNDKLLRFYVKDTGIGIKPELHGRIFERFLQADELIQVAYGGTGLGLSISKGFVELLGGKIWVESEPFKGSVFYFTVPYKPVSEPDPATKTSLTASGKKGDARKVLIAEDLEYNFLLFEQVFKGMNIELIPARDGQEAVNICRSNPSIDLILMDIKMPVMDGYSATKLIKEFRPELPVIAQSAYALENDRSRYGETFDDYITKPIDREELIQKISKYIGTVVSEQRVKS